MKINHSSRILETISLRPNSAIIQPAAILQASPSNGAVMYIWLVDRSATNIVDIVFASPQSCVTMVCGSTSAWLISYGGSPSRTTVSTRTLASKAYAFIKRRGYSNSEEDVAAVCHDVMRRSYGLALTAGRSRECLETHHQRPSSMVEVPLTDWIGIVSWMLFAPFHLAETNGALASE